MPDLIIGDIHLSDKPKDAYRFDIFPWIRQQQKRYKVRKTILLGDITENKDRHPATLVNKVVNSILSIEPVITIRGNHDCINPDNPFFGFLNYLSRFVIEPDVISNYGIIPHCRTQTLFNEAVKQLSSAPFDTLLLHNTFTGAISETGSPLSGLQCSWVDYFKPARVYAGDVHKPQQAGPVTYVGAPYQIRFGDNYKPRVLLVDGDSETELYFPAPRKWNLTISSPNDLEQLPCSEGDQLKLTVELAKEEVLEWKTMKEQIKSYCKDVNIELYGVTLKVKQPTKREQVTTAIKTPQEILTSFCLQEGVNSQIKQAGMKYV